MLPGLAGGSAAPSDGARMLRMLRTSLPAWRCCAASHGTQADRQEFSPVAWPAKGRAACSGAALLTPLPAPYSPTQGGMLYAVLLSALALGLPFGLAVFPAHAFRQGGTWAVQGGLARVASCTHAAAAAAPASPAC